MRHIFLLLPALFTIACSTPTIAAGADASTLVNTGIPALDREWSGADYMRSAELLKSGKLPLPTLDDPEGRSFFKRSTSTDNLSLLRNRSVPAEQRIKEFYTMMGGADIIMKLYMTAATKEGKFHTEVTHQLAFSLRLAAAGAQLMEEYIPTIPKDDKYEARLNGLKQTYSGTTTMFMGCEMTLGETRFYSADDLSLLLRVMAETLPVFKKAFSNGFKAELRTKLESRKADFHRIEDANNLQKMINDLRS